MFIQRSKEKQSFGSDGAPAMFSFKWLKIASQTDGRRLLLCSSVLQCIHFNCSSFSMIGTKVEHCLANSTKSWFSMADKVLPSIASPSTTTSLSYVISGFRDETCNLAYSVIWHWLLALDDCSVAAAWWLFLCAFTTRRFEYPIEEYSCNRYTQ